MIVELAGLPGCGKSTINRRIAGDLRRIGRVVFSPTFAISCMKPYLRLAVKVAYAARLLLWKPRWWLRIVAVGRHAAQPSRLEEFKLDLNNLFVASILDRFSRLKLQAGSIVFLDQGGLQAIASVCMKARNRKAALQLACLPALLQADLCFLLRIDPEVASRRLARRPGRLSRAEDQSAGVQRRRLEQIEGDLDIVLKAVAGRMPVLTVSALDQDRLLEELLLFERQN